jgi:hypothetical protein
MVERLLLEKKKCPRKSEKWDSERLHRRETAAAASSKKQHKPFARCEALGILAALRSIQKARFSLPRQPEAISPMGPTTRSEPERAVVPRAIAPWEKML